MSTLTPADRIAVSSWSLHRLLGVTFPHDLETRGIGAREETFGAPSAALTDLPALCKTHQITRLEICSFHLPSRDSGYLGELRDALASAGVTLQTLLIEAGDLSDAATSQRDATWISRWVETATELGAENARIIAGKQKASPETLDRAAEGLLAIARDHGGTPTRLVTENWFDLLSRPEDVNYLLDRTEGQIGLNGDFGNWTGASKYNDLGLIFGRASLCHAKARFYDSRIDAEDYLACIDVAEGAGYVGPYTLIFDAETPSEWEGIATERNCVLGALAA
jgi:sugar phosphate isomerase/epimerase